MPIFSFPDDAVWNDELRAVEFSVELGDYRGRVRVARAVFQALLSTGPTPELCVEAFHLDRARFERAAERKIALRQLSADGNLDLTLKDLKEA
ncbi:MAG TPA: DUF1488 family protein [Aliidongia sp.]|nr:DUF1488 family protein [Aliidongia sp.]